MDQSGERQILSMNKGWRFYRGEVPMLAGQDHDALYGAAKAGGKGGPARSGFDDSAWERVSLPHDWAVGGDFDPQARVSHGYKHTGFGW